MSRVPTIRLSPRHRRWLAGIFGLLWGSGALWLVFHYFLGAEGDYGPVPSPLEKWWLGLHGLAAFAALAAAGSVLPVHARRAWELNKNRATGLGMQAALAWLALTGYALYYFADPDTRPWLPWLHWAAGLGLPALVALHIGRGRARRKTRARAAAVSGVVNEHLVVRLHAPRQVVEGAPHAGKRQLVVLEADDVGVLHAQALRHGRGGVAVARHAVERRDTVAVMTDGHDEGVVLGPHRGGAQCARRKERRHHDKTQCPHTRCLVDE